MTLSISSAIDRNSSQTSKLFPVKVVKSKNQKYKNSKTKLPIFVQMATKTTTAMVKRTNEEPQEQKTALIKLESTRKILKPTFHPPWILKTLISGHTGPIRSLAIDPSNMFFASGGGDRLIKLWDLASGTLKLSLTGHIGTVRGLEISDRHPYLFSAGNEFLIQVRTSKSSAGIWK
jgi:pleiotropic regulator 1